MGKKRLGWAFFFFSLSGHAINNTLRFVRYTVIKIKLAFWQIKGHTQFFEIWVCLQFGQMNVSPFPTIHRRFDQDQDRRPQSPLFFRSRDLRNAMENKIPIITMMTGFLYPSSKNTYERQTELTTMVNSGRGCWFVSFSFITILNIALWIIFVN